MAGSAEDVAHPTPMVIINNERRIKLKMVNTKKTFGILSTRETI